MTAVEGIRQILLGNPNAKVLACAPSNSAADIIAQRLIRSGLGVLEVFRLNAPSRPPGDLPEDLRPYTLLLPVETAHLPEYIRNRGNRNDIFGSPSKEKLMKYKVIVTTCVQGCVPHGIGIPRGHFSHILVDEAGQALEPEVMIPIRVSDLGLS